MLLLEQLLWPGQVGGKKLLWLEPPGRALCHKETRMLQGALGRGKAGSRLRSLPLRKP